MFLTLYKYIVASNIEVPYALVERQKKVGPIVCDIDLKVPESYGKGRERLYTDDDVMAIAEIYLKTIKETLKYEDKVPINSFEGFIRQIIGWRNYIYATYLLIGDNMKKSNFFNHKNKLNKKTIKNKNKNKNKKNKTKKRYYHKKKYSRRHR